MTHVTLPPRGGLPPRLRARLTHLLFSGRTAAEAVAHNKLRAGLTALGMLFGVASVIAMLAIGHGAEHAIMAQMKLLGTNTILVTPVIEQPEGKVDEESKKEPTKFTPGLTALDAAAIRAEVPHVTATSGEVVLKTIIMREGRARAGTLVGVDANYFRLMHLQVGQGSGFTAPQFETASPVAIIGPGVQARFFPTEPPLGHRIKVGTVWLTVVGVLAGRGPVSAETAKHLGIRDVTMDLYVPLPTMLLRYRNRAEVTQADLDTPKQASDDSTQSDEARAERRNYHQLDHLVVQVDQSPLVPAAAEVVRRMLQRWHNDVTDFEITVPELLLKQEQNTKRLFTIVLGAIASISLVVGGIGIMNIMLASILERTREIGVRRAVGATQQDVLWQFLAEAVMVSLAGGVAGIGVGVLLSVGIARLAHVPTLVSPWSIVIAFGVSVAVGLLFGILPASQAAQRDPIVCLRYE